MVQAELLDMQKILRSRGILISFAGRFTQGIIEELGDAVKKYMEIECRPQTVIFNVFALFVEQTQNIKNYITANTGDPSFDLIENSGIIAIGRTDSGYYVSSGNIIKNADAAVLAERLTTLASLDKAEIKRLYKEQMKKPLPPGSSSAGIGLIDMAKRAGAPLEFSFVPVDDCCSFFTLKVVV